MESFPEPLLKRASHDGNGELAWPKPQAAEVTAWLARCGIAVLGGEAWLVDAAGGISGVLPSREGGPPFVWGWVTPQRGDTEDWSDCCLRAAAHAEHALRHSPVEDSCAVEALNGIHYNLTYCDEERHRRLRSAPAR
jgi:hypothetical protein